MIRHSEIEREIQHLRELLNRWLDEIYHDCEEKRYNGEWDCGYTGWNEIETLIGHIFDNRLISQLSSQMLDDVLFFISRNEECGRIIAWLSSFKAKPFSNIGNLVYEDFLVLCDRALQLPDDFCDYQLVACFRKREVLDEDEVEMLIRFFEKKSDSYTRRQVLHSLSEFKIPELIPLAKQLWESDHCEFAKISCLIVLQPFPGERPLFNRYLQEYQSLFPVDEADYRQVHMKKFLEAESL